LLTNEGGEAMKNMNENEIMSLTVDDFRDLTPEETQQDNFRRLFQMLGIIYKNQNDIKELLAAAKQS